MTSTFCQIYAKKWKVWFHFFLHPYLHWRTFARSILFTIVFALSYLVLFALTRVSGQEGEVRGCT